MVVRWHVFGATHSSDGCQNLWLHVKTEYKKGGFKKGCFFFFFFK